MIRDRLPLNAAMLFPKCSFRLGLNLRDHPRNERDALSGIKVVGDMEKPKPDVPSAAADVFQHDVHRIVADVVAGSIGMTNLRAKLDVESCW